jgi:hypothetical protein
MINSTLLSDPSSEVSGCGLSEGYLQGLGHLARGLAIC